MKLRIVTTFILLAFSAGQASAACPHTTGANSPLSNAGIKTALAGAGGAGKFHCAIRGGEKWNESLGVTNTGNNTDSGTLTDFKRGAGNPVDPTKVVGTWTINNSQIAYTYGTTGGTFTYTVREVTAGTNYEFCNIATNEQINAIVTTAPTANPAACP